MAPPESGALGIYTPLPPGHYATVQALEGLGRRDSLTYRGGVIGITKNKEAMHRWMILYPFKNSVYEALSLYLELQSDSASDINHHNEWTQSRINKDKRDIQNIIKYFSACKPCKGNEERVLRNIYTGELADKSSSPCLLNIVENGETLLSTYENERFVLRMKKLSDPIKGKTFYNFENVSTKENIKYF
ncbi:hypothetical protein AVEN_29672-1 [Araneus ventricosus]|uniref:Uncharacterized protein n=1 Tax=Araneus ventricosus TaxID=182803 RepID=A0A4Y2V276_ARAVE|nr:hypothetical protein AVEN_110500-1 [Araneus ventricosus]GBO18632.1 hypothetical protein AVEN_29672-1 [Araneus ventricosus]